MTTLVGSLLAVLDTVEVSSGMRPAISVELDGEALRHVKRSITKEMRGAVQFDERNGAPFEFMGIMFNSIDKDYSAPPNGSPWDFTFKKGMVYTDDHPDMRGMGE